MKKQIDLDSERLTVTDRHNRPVLDFAGPIARELKGKSPIELMQYTKRLFRAAHRNCKTETECK